MKIYEMEGHYLYQLGDLTIKTDTWERRGQDSVLGIGGTRRGNVPMLMNYMLNHPEIVEGKRVFEPFAGAGPHGFLALSLGAEFCDLLDVNPRAIQFMNDTASINGFDESAYAIIREDIESFQPDTPYDIIFANPPFVPTPPSVTGVLHSNGGPDGCRLTRSLLTRLDQFLKPTGQAVIFSLQIEGMDGPILAADVQTGGMSRPVEMMRTTDCYIDFEVFARHLILKKPDQKESVLGWQHELQKRYGNDLRINWYLIHIGQRESSKTACTVTDFNEEKYGKAYAPKPVDHEKRIKTLVDFEIFR